MSLRSVEASIVLPQHPSRATSKDEPARIHVSLSAGELAVLSGPSLSGKTAILHCLAGWEQPEHSEVSWPGADASPPPWSELTIIPQAFAVLDELTVLENITLARRLNPAQIDDRRDQLDHVLEALGLYRLCDRGIAEVSVGERQRVMVARALADSPDMILADEPVVHQDRQNADAIRRLLTDAVQAGAACLFATRHPAEAPETHRTIALESSGPRERTRRLNKFPSRPPIDPGALRARHNTRSLGIWSRGRS